MGEVVDFMAPSHDGGPPAHPGPLLVRRLRAVRGTVAFMWVAFERAIRIDRQRGLPAPIARWRDIANCSYHAVQREGWSSERRSYVQYFGGTTLDASLLVVPPVKFVGPTDPRFPATLDRTGEELVSDNLVRRCEPDGSEGLPGSEGTFHLCSFWYVEALTRAGRVDEGRYVFEKMLTHANHVGLFAEEIGPAGEALGNFPQASTHLPLISACNLDRALSGEPPPPRAKQAARPPAVPPVI